MNARPATLHPGADVGAPCHSSLVPLSSAPIRLRASTLRRPCFSWVWLTYVRLHTGAYSLRLWLAMSAIRNLGTAQWWLPLLLGLVLPVALSCHARRASPYSLLRGPAVRSSHAFDVEARNRGVGTPCCSESGPGCHTARHTNVRPMHGSEEHLFVKVLPRAHCRGTRPRSERTRPRFPSQRPLGHP